MAHGVSCWIPTATSKHSEYVIRIHFARQQQLRQRASLSSFTYIARLLWWKIRVLYCDGGCKVVIKFRRFWFLGRHDFIHCLNTWHTYFIMSICGMKDSKLCNLRKCRRQGNKTTALCTQILWYFGIWLCATVYTVSSEKAQYIYQHKKMSWRHKIMWPLYWPQANLTFHLSWL